MRHSPWDWEGHDWRQWIPPFSRRSRFFEAGEIRLAILSLIGERPRHGYELMKELELRSGGTYKSSAGTMYPTLQQLEDEGLIVPEVKDGRKVYQTTAAGRAELENERAKVDGIWNRAEHWDDWANMWTAGRVRASIGGSLGQLMKTTIHALKHSRGDARTSEEVSRILDRATAEIAGLEKRA
jgi:DNA-binding PadR family transcriptional regulator